MLLLLTAHERIFALLLIGFIFLSWEFKESFILLMVL